MAERLPFHETIEQAIRTTKTGNGLNLIAWLLMQTKIPKGHDEIVAAIKESIPGVGLSGLRSFWDAVIADVLEQKRDAEVEARQKKEREDRLMREDALER